MLRCGGQQKWSVVNHATVARRSYAHSLFSDAQSGGGGECRKVCFELVWCIDQVPVILSTIDRSTAAATRSTLLPSPVTTRTTFLVFALSCTATELLVSLSPLPAPSLRPLLPSVCLGLSAAV